MMTAHVVFKITALSCALTTIYLVLENVGIPGKLRNSQKDSTSEILSPMRPESLRQTGGELTPTNVTQLLQYYINNIVQRNFKVELKSAEDFTEEMVNIILLNQTRTTKTVTEKREDTKTDKESEQSRPSLLCWILADPHLLDKKVIHQKQTWGKRCDKLLVMSSQQNDTFPTVGLNVTAGRDHIGSKVLAAWKYIHKHYVENYDFFIKTDPDTYLIVENLLDFLKDKDPSKPYFYGHRYRPRKWKFTYMAGGPGLVLTRESVRRLVTKAFIEHPKCLVDGQGEDYKVCRCLNLVGCAAQDTRDAAGKERFLVFEVSLHLQGLYPQWYREYDMDGALQGQMCCSDHPISFHYVKPINMHVLEYWLYHAKVHGKDYSLTTNHGKWVRDHSSLTTNHSK